jgi:hypothetical protein
MKSKILLLAAVVGLLPLAGLTAVAQDTTTPTPPTTGIVRPPLPDAIKDLMQQFREQRREFLQARQQLVERLKTASEEERKALVAQFRLEQRTRLQAQMELRKEIRRQLLELRRQRRQAGAGSGG